MARRRNNSRIIFTLLLTALAVSAASVSPAQDEPAPTTTPPATPARPIGLHPTKTYFGVNRPVLIEVIPPRSFGSFSIILMDAFGTVVDAPMDVRGGTVDLLSLFTRLHDMRAVHYLQLVDLDQPIGSALVLQPMLARLVPITEKAVHPVYGHTYDRIVGWRDENLAPDPLENWKDAPEPAESDEEDDTDDEQDNEDTEPPAPPVEIPVFPLRKPIDNRGQFLETESTGRLMTGFRIFPERDVILHTTEGDIHLAMSPEAAPNTAWNFLELASGGFYDDVIFHRIVPLTQEAHPFVIQAGDPSATGDGGPGYWLPLERSELPHDLGIISMARSDDPDSAGSQFFICLSRRGTARLDGQYTSFGYAVDGLDTIRAIAQTELTDIKAGKPAIAPIIRSAEVVDAPPRRPKFNRYDTRIDPNIAPERDPAPTRVPR